MPGVTFLDILYRILRARNINLEEAEFRNILFVEPVVATTEFDREMHVELVWQSSYYQVLAKSRKVKNGKILSDEWTRHLEARLYIDSPLAAPTLRIEEAKRRSLRQSDVEEVYARGRSVEIQHDEFMKCHGVIYHREGGLLAELSLSDEARAHLEDFYLHPAMLDSSTMQSYAFVFEGINSDLRPLIPMHIGSFRALGPLGDACVVNLSRTGETREQSDVVYLDIDLHDLNGKLVARFQKLSMKRVRSKELITRLTLENSGRAADSSSFAVIPKSEPSPPSKPAGDVSSARQPATRLQAIEGEVIRAIRESLGDGSYPVDPQRGFYDLGLESTHLLQLVRTLEEKWKIELYPTLLFEYNTVESLAEYLNEKVVELEPVREVAAPVTSATEQQGETLYFTGLWESEPDVYATVGEGEDDGNVLLFEHHAPGFEDFSKLARTSKPNGAVVLVQPGEAFQQIDFNHYRIRPGAREDYTRLLSAMMQSGMPPQKIVHLWPRVSEATPPDELPAVMESGCEAVFYLTQALMSERSLGRVSFLDVHFSGGSGLISTAAGMVGFAKTIRLENPRFFYKVAELRSPSGRTDEWPSNRLMSMFARELRDERETWVRYEDGRRLVRRYRELVPDKDFKLSTGTESGAPPPLRERGVYLISGGNGGLGRIFAAWLAKTTRARLVLFGRSGLSAQVQADLRQLEEMGAEVLYVQADVAHRSDVARLVQQAKSRFGQINGVIHSAGVLSDSLIFEKSSADLSRVFAPKMRGLVNLDEATRDERLDFFVLFSSVTGVIGNVGQTDYAIANGFMNAYADFREALRAGGKCAGQTVSICWPLWHDGGMQVDSSTLEYFRQQGQIPLPNQAGTGAFLLARKQSNPELIVFHGEREKIVRSIATRDPKLDLPQQSFAAHVGGEKVAVAEPAAASGDIAIIGLAGQYPMAQDLEQFWQNLIEGRDCITEIPASRWSHEEFFDAEKHKPGKSYSRWGGFLEDADRFDPHFFQITPREAASMDPQERLFMETVWHTMEDAGYTRAGLTGSTVGVFVGVMFNQYQMYGPGLSPEEQLMVPTSFSSSVANRVSYFFDFRGPSLALDTMCSSSLTAIHLACESLRRGDCELAFAGGVNVSAHPYKYIYLSQATFLSSDGRCRSFGAGGDGYVPGEGVGAVLLKPLERAVADRDRIYGVVKGSSINHGGRSGGYTVPNQVAQANLIRKAFERAGVNPETISYLEAHGTGTSLGDPIEMAGLEKVFGSLNDGREACPIGSVKSNIGHLEPAAGIAGVTKVLLQMKHKTLVPSLHSTPPNPAVNWAKLPFRVQTEVAAWNRPASLAGGVERILPLRSGVSAFGAGGSNAHVILEEYVSTESGSDYSTAPFVVLLSAKKEENLLQLAERYLEFLEREATAESGAGTASAQLKARLLDELSGIASELFGLDRRELDPASGMEEWGLDSADAQLFAQKIGERYQLDEFAPPLDMSTSMNELAERLLRELPRQGAAAQLSGDETLKLARIAYTTQVGREPMEERLALVVSDVAELRESLTAFVNGNRSDGRLYRGTVKQKGRVATDETELALRNRNLDLLARLWASGINPDWRSLYGDNPPERVALPLYPFTRQRCWVKTAPERLLLSSDARAAVAENLQPEEKAFSASGQRTSDVRDVAAAGSGELDFPAEDFLYTPQWSPAPLALPGEMAREDVSKTVVILYTTTGQLLANALAATHAGREIFFIELGRETRRRANNHWEVDTSDADAFKALRAALPEPGLIYFMGGLLDTSNTEEMIETELLAREEENGILSLFRFAKELINQSAARGALSWKIITNDVWPVADAEVLNPYAAGLSGLARVFESEYPQWAVPVIDLGLGGVVREVTEAQWRELAAWIVAEPSVRGARIARRRQIRYRETLYPLSLPAAAGARLREGGVFMLIGGAGGIGLEIASFMVRRHGARVALVGRSAMDAQKEQNIAAIDSEGSHVAYFQADALSAHSLRRAVEQVRERFGAIHGVIHSALVQNDGSVKNMEERLFRQSVATKSRISVVLHEVFKHEPLDFLLFFSSVQSFLGDAGLGNYAAGCAFEDAYAHYLSRRLSFPVRTFNWGYWGTVGAVATDYYREKMARAGFGSVTPQAAWEAIRRGLHSPTVQVVPMPGDRHLLQRMGVDFGTKLVFLPEASLPSAGRLESELLPSDESLKTVASFNFVDREMGKIAAGWLLMIFREAGIFLQPEESLERETIARRLRVVPRYERLLDELLNILSRSGLVREQDGRYSLAAHIREDAAVKKEELVRDMNALAGQHTDVAVFMNLLSLILPRYGEILRGELLATDLLFSGSSTSLMEGVYKGNTISDFYNDLTASCVHSYVTEQIPRLRADEKIRILEVGSGTGGAAASILRKIGKYGDKLEYAYTDLSVTFLEHGKQQFGLHYPFMVFKRLDAEKDFQRQGFEFGGYDLVVAANVLHVSSDIRRTLVNIKSTVRAGGWVVLNELTSVTTQAAMTYGLLDGWWRYDDAERRLHNSPLLDLAGWRQLLEETGYHGFVSLPAAHQTEKNYQHVIVAQSDGGCFVQNEALTVAAEKAAEPTHAAQVLTTERDGHAEPPARVAAPRPPEDAPAASITAPVVEEIDEQHLLRLFEREILQLTSSTSGIALEELDPDEELNVFGFDSISFSLLSDRLNKQYGFNVTPTIFYETPTLGALIRRLHGEYLPTLKEHYGDRAKAAVKSVAPDATQGEAMVEAMVEARPASPPANATPAPLPVRQAAVQDAREPIAIIGIAGILPQSADLEEFWQHLINGKDLITEVPPDRWKWSEVGQAFKGPAAGLNLRWGGFINEVDRFDPLFFGISPREAENMDPQQRLFLQTVWSALEDAGIAPGSLAGSDTGLFVGVGSSDYQELQDVAGIEIDAYGATANAHSILVNRISYLLNLHGPSEPVNTGCSSSLVALHRAVSAIENGECELTIAGGVNLLLSPKNFVLLSRTGMLSPDGRCKTFDERANGFVRGEGMGALVLTRLSRAEAEGHSIYGLVRGSAVNHGGRARSLTAPNPSSQAQMLVKAYEKANLDPETISYIETHGTGTALGDPVEINGLKLAFSELFKRWGKTEPKRAYCALGAVKSNIGHLESAAGVAGVLKLLLAMKYGKLPGSLHFETLNPYIKVEDSPFYILNETKNWERLHDDEGRELPYRAGVSSFGYGGVNAHVVLEEYVKARPVATAPPAAHIFVLSARTPSALLEYAGRCLSYLTGMRDRRALTPERDFPSLTDIAYTLQVGRDAMRERLAVVADSLNELIEKLSLFVSEGKKAAQLFTGNASEASRNYDSLLEGDEGAEFLRRIVAQHKLEKIAQLWVNGVEVDWKQFYSSPLPGLAHLPTYPFERQRYWVPVEAQSSRRVEDSSSAADDKDPAEDPLNKLLYTPRWIPASDSSLETAIESGSDGATMIVYSGDGAALAEAIASSAAGREPFLIELGTRNRRVEANKWEVDALDPTGFKVLFPSLPDPSVIYFLGGLRRPQGEAGLQDQLALLERGEQDGILALFRLVKELLERPVAASGLTLKVVTNDACPVDGHPVRNPFAAHVRGFLKSLLREYPGWDAMLMDFDWDEVSEDFERTAREIVARRPLKGDESAYRGNQRFHESLVPLALPPVAGSPFRSGGVYLIIGGAGNIGLEVASYLIHEHKARVVLAGRSALDDAKRQRIARIDSRGDNLLYVRADATDVAALARVGDEAREKFGAVRGVIHAANVLKDRSLHNMDEASFREGMQAKTKLCASLVQVLGDAPLDFMLFFSSVQSFLGNPGQSNYAAGCTFEDAYAHYLHDTLAYPVRVINWGAWGNEGLAAQYRERLNRAGVISIPPAEGLEAILRVLHHDTLEVVPVYGTPDFLKTIGVEDPAGLEVTHTMDDAASDDSHEVPERESADAPGDAGTLTQNWMALLKGDVHRLVSETSNVPPGDLNIDEELSRYGFDSIGYTLLSNKLNEKYALGVTPAYFFGLSTTSSLIEKLAKSHPAKLRDYYASRAARKAAPPPRPDKPASPEAVSQTGSAAKAAPAKDASRRAAVERPQAAPPPTVEAVAIVGMAAVLPQSENLEEFWAHLVEGRDLITEIPPDRWDWERIYGDPHGGGFKTLSKWGGFMRGVQSFDPLFFGISPKEAEAMDPQHRLFLQTVWSCIENAGISPASLAGTDTGVFVGVSTFDYSEIQQACGIELDGYNAVGRAHALLPNRVSYLLDFHGPSEAIDTACSSSLVAVQRAVEAIQYGNCDMALAGGVNVILSPTLHVDLGKAGMLSGEGRCKTFDKGANGFVRAEGVGVVLLKRLSLAEADGDPIHGVIRGGAINHGGKTNSLTAPNPDAQAALLIRAYTRAGVDPTTVTYIETHGTGTELGDPVEIDALKQAFASLYRAWGVEAATRPHCALGALKSNLGHLEAAAGVAGLLKVLLSMKHGLLPRNLHLEEVNPYIRLEESPFYILRRQQPWTHLQDKDGGIIPLRAGVSSFGVGGVNAHLIIEEYLSSDSEAPDDRPNIFVLSAKSKEALRNYAAEFASFLNRETAAAEASLRDRLASLLSETLHIRREDINLEETFGELGLESAELALFARKVEESSDLPVPPDLISEDLTLDEFLQSLTRGGHEPLGHDAGAVSAVSLSRLAYTLQSGRNAMEERLAIVARDLAELSEKLSRYLKGERGIAGVFEGNARERRADSETPLESGENSESLKALIANQRLDEIARLWVGGALIDWKLLYPDGYPKRLSVPTYPFAKESYWIKPGPSAERARVVNGDLLSARPADGAEASASPKNGNGSAPKPSVVVAESTSLEDEVQSRIKLILAEHLGLSAERLEADRNFAEYGVDSLGIKRLSRELNSLFDIEVPATLFYSAQSIQALARRLLEEHPRKLEEGLRHTARREQADEPQPGEQGADPLNALIRNLQAGDMTVDQALEQLGAMGDDRLRDRP
jgi:acyl transferase domain-containing protein/SAM-dependent methyltransferase/aryl carrier-like protein